jgi:hypothetical protein
VNNPSHEFVKSLVFVETLLYYDFPLLFASVNSSNAGDMFLTLWCGFTETKGSRLIMVPTTKKIIKELRDNKLELLEALAQHDMWEIEEDPAGNIISVRNTTIDQFDKTYPNTLPMEGVCLYSNLEK